MPINKNTQNKSKKTYKKKTRHSKSLSTKPQPNSVQKIRLYPSPELHKVTEVLAGSVL
ncbi:hypothetical protein MiSe_39570 [Microseira wollei NIES-4236]|uniref:Transposase n=1 Tax=Microseira wollei NIES-4236 TaxID=2530354 RepID=A0AAV3XCR3_9CYAN|nr:hypothetical protein MiSe_39570 [Microseira wollei NIES-4236]